MTISKGSNWGTAVSRPDRLIEAADDRGLADLFARHRGDQAYEGAHAGEQSEPGEGAAAPITVVGGDLFRSLGSPAARDEMVRLPIDIMSVTLDDVEQPGVAQLLMYRSRWRGPAIAVCNVSFYGDWNLAPKAHPNDGRVDVLEVDGRFGVRMRAQARRRLPNGTHVPHPLVSYARVREREWKFDRPMRCFLDHREPIRASRVRVVVIPDATSVYV